MKKILLALVACSTFFTITSNAFAIGQGGIAGTAAFYLDGGVVLDASAAIAVGKSTAQAASIAFDGGGTEAYALGASGTVTMGSDPFYIGNVAEDTAIGTAQANNLSTTTTSIDAKAGTIDHDVVTPVP